MGQQYQPQQPVWRPGYGSQPPYRAPYGQPSGPGHGQPQPQPTPPQAPQPRYSGPPRNHVPAEDAKAALAAYSELGPEYSQEVVDSFLAQIDARMVGRQQDSLRQSAELQARYHQNRSDRGFRTAWLVIILVLAIPLTAIAAQFGFLGMVISWIGVVAVAGFMSGFGRGGLGPKQLGR